MKHWVNARFLVWLLVNALFARTQADTFQDLDMAQVGIEHLLDLPFHACGYDATKLSRVDTAVVCFSQALCTA